MRVVHLGLGNFFRSHQAWYTDRAPDAADWGIAAFTGRRPDLARALTGQDGLFTLVTRAAQRDDFEVVASVSAAHAAADHRQWLGYVGSVDVAVVTCTVTEAGYCRGPGGGLDRNDAVVEEDIHRLRDDLTQVVRSVPGRLVAGLAARRTADAGPLTVVPCDNLPDNGGAVGRVVREFAHAVDPGLAEWIDAHVGFVTTMVDRITPTTTTADVRLVQDRTGYADAVPVVTEPFSEWVLADDFVAGRPHWEAAGATFTTDVATFEQRKLWLLNGGHSLLAYVGSARGHRTVADAVDDHTCRALLEQWWDEAAGYLRLADSDIRGYRGALLERFANRRMRHRLEQIAADGSAKLPVRVLPVLRQERANGRVPGAAVQTLAAWIHHLRGGGMPVRDPRAAELTTFAEQPPAVGVRRVLAVLDPALADDDALVRAVEAAMR